MSRWQESQAQLQKPLVDLWPFRLIPLSPHLCCQSWPSFSPDSLTFSLAPSAIRTFPTLKKFLLLIPTFTHLLPFISSSEQKLTHRSSSPDWREDHQEPPSPKIPNLGGSSSGESPPLLRMLSPSTPAWRSECIIQHVMLMSIVSIPPSKGCGNSTTQYHHPSTFLGDRPCEEHFCSTFSRDSDGRFEVQLSFSTNCGRLGDSRHKAISCFKSLEKQLQRDPRLKDAYYSQIEEYISKNWVTAVPSSNLNCTTTITTIGGDQVSLPPFYLPHHVVVKPDNTTAKFRIFYTVGDTWCSIIIIWLCHIILPDMTKKKLLLGNK